VRRSTAVDLFLAPGEDDDRQVEGLAQPPGDGQAILVGQLEVQDHQVHDFRGQDLVHVCAGLRERDLEIVLLQVFTDQLANRHVVIDDQDVGFHCFYGPVVSLRGILPPDSVESLQP
jgi:hypothetical protein